MVFMVEVLNSAIYQDVTPEVLLQEALAREEGILCANGALTVHTGTRTGRSPKDRFIVHDALTADTIDWGSINQPMDIGLFNQLWTTAIEYLSTRDHFISHLEVGADQQHYLPVKVITEYAWHNLFAQHLFIRNQPYNSQNKPTWTLVNATRMPLHSLRTHLNSDAVVAIDLSGRRILLCGTAYAGEMKKALFTVLNYFLPENDILPMHCAANQGEANDVSLFFGLSGTGKTTLSANPERQLIGDDEHGWSSEGVFNFEGGCYAKCIHLSQENEPVIWKAIRHGAIMENVVLDHPTLLPDFTDTRITQNTRAAYPLDFIEKKVLNNRGAVPNAVIFLTCDLYGVLPPVSKLNLQQAAYYFLSGYTALVGSTEFGAASSISPTFSTCFGAPFFPRPAVVYANLLMKRLQAANCPVYLVNTGWTGGAYGSGGTRFSLSVTRAILDAIHRGELAHTATCILPGFNLAIPVTVTGVDALLLDPRHAWKNSSSYRENLNTLIDQFTKNFQRFPVSNDIIAAGPKPFD